MGKGDYIKRAIRSEKVVSTPKSFITDDQLREIQGKVWVGDRISYIDFDGYMIKDDVKKTRVTGEVLEKYQNFVLMKVGKYKTCVLWIDLLLRNMKRENYDRENYFTY